MTVPSSPATISTYSISGASSLNSVRVQGHYAYVSDGSNGKMFVVDISNPNSPSLVNTITAPSGLYHALPVGKYLYTKSDNGHIYIYDITNPLSIPTYLSDTDTGQTAGIL